MENLLAVVKAAGGGAENIVKLNLFVTDKKNLPRCGQRNRRGLPQAQGQTFPGHDSGRREKPL
ncbi:MAG TPA: RidA family protein [Methylomirabilota bacterium]|nr:RidA family protein [Methylomirabilota bacterium]